MKRILAPLMFLCISAALFTWLVQAGEPVSARYRVLEAVTEQNLAVYPVVSETILDTSGFITLDEGMRSGKVTVGEMTEPAGLVRPRQSTSGPAINDGVWREHPMPVPVPNPVPFSMPFRGPRVNELALVNSSDSPLLLLAGEIVTGGKQDRIVAKDRIVPAHGGPVSLGVFCVEPHRWIGASSKFGSVFSTMAQPDIRAKALSVGDQQQVWEAVAKFREGVASNLPRTDAAQIAASSSYAQAVESDGVKRQLDSIASPMEHAYDRLMKQFRSQHIVGTVVAVNGDLIWADIFASPALLEQYWPKLIRSYAAEALTPKIVPTIARPLPAPAAALEFLNQRTGNRESIETEPGVYRNTEVTGSDFESFILTSLLPNTGYDVHIAKMKR